jgi:hypothetical protein
MLRRFRHAIRVRLVDAVRDGTRNGLEADLGAVRDDLAALRAQVRALHERVDALDTGLRDYMWSWERRQRRDLLTAVDYEALESSAAFMRAEFGTAKPCFDKFDTLRAALAEAPQEGMWLEFGVASGSTLKIIVEHAPEGAVHGFDSFEGLPEDWRPGFEAGAFATDELPDVPGANLVVGWFDDTLPAFLKEHQDPVAFLHVDADLYSSTRTVLTGLASRMRVGTVILFDEYFNFPGWEEHEHRAWTEFVAEHDLRFEYVTYSAEDEQVAVRLLTAPAVSQESHRDADEAAVPA